MKEFCLIIAIIFSLSLSLLAVGMPASEEAGNESNQVEVDEVDDETEAQSCSAVFADHGMNYTAFHKGVAHGVHALSLEEIRYFFQAEAPEENLIPTVNTDFRQVNSPVLFNAPLWGYSERFLTWSLKILDFFMLHDKPYFYETVSCM